MRALSYLFLISLSAMTARAGDFILGARHPFPTPDAERLVFALHGDIWVAEVQTGRARRLTAHEADDDNPVLSPDGRTLVFSSDRDGPTCLYVTPLDGGQVRRLSFHGAGSLPMGFSPDGSEVLFASRHSRMRNLYRIPVEGGTPLQVTVTGARFGVYLPDGKDVVYGRGFVDTNLLGYEGSSNYDLFQAPVDASSPPARLTWSESNDVCPAVGSDGKIFWARGKTLFSSPLAPLATPAPSATLAPSATPAPVADFPDDVRYVSVAGKTLFVESGFQIYTLVPGEAPQLLQLQSMSDEKRGKRLEREILDRPDEPDCAPDGTLAFSMDGAIWVVGPGGGVAKKVTSGGKESWPRFFANGDSIVFQSESQGQSDLFAISRKGGQARQLTSDPANDFYHSVSRGNVVFCSEREGSRDIFLLRLKTGELRRVTSWPKVEDDPDLSPDGQMLAFDSDRSGDRDIWLFDIVAGQAKRLTSGSPIDQCPAFSPDGQMLAFERREGARSTLMVFDLATRRMQGLAANAAAARWSSDGKWIYYADQGKRGGIRRVEAPHNVPVNEPVFITATESVQRDSLNLRMLDEVYNTIAERFYDPATHGVSWSEVRERYLPVVQEATSPAERTLWLNRMLGELHASHMGLRWASSHAPSTGDPGISWSLHADTLVVASVLERGAAHAAHIQTGFRLLSVDGRTINRATNLWELFDGRAGERVTLRFLTPSGEKDVTLKLMSLGQRMRLEFSSWYRERQRLVKELSGGKIAYVHLPAMQAQNLDQFKTALAAQKSKDALIIDIRNNVGGNIHEGLLQILMLRNYGLSKTRGKKGSPRFSPVWEKPFAVLINERSFSDAEIFPYAVQSLGLAPLIGVPTSGGVIGTVPQTLSDGSVLRVPRTGWFGNDKTDLEGLGVIPDIMIYRNEEDRFFNRDPQLQAAVEHLLLRLDGGEKSKEIPKRAAPQNTKPRKL